MLKTLTDAYHGARVEAAEAAGTPMPAYEDTAFWVRLAALALFAEALIGPLLTDSGRLENPDAAHEILTSGADIDGRHPRAQPFTGDVTVERAF